VIEIPDASMADVAFLLLIFFLSTTTVTQEESLSLLLPGSPTTQGLSIARRQVLVITTDPSGEAFFVDGEPIALGWIQDLIRERRALDPETVVSVEPHPAAPYRAMIDILDELKLGGATRIAIKTRGL
jgi:biopolymer transport protein ExbD